MFNVEFEISGLSYMTSLAQKLAIAVLLLHIAVAASHSVCLVVRGKSSACWDSVTEIMVIAQNSEPAFKALENTAAGIQHLFTFSKKVVIRSTKLPDSEEADHLRLELAEEGAGTEDQRVELEASYFEFTELANRSIAESEEQSSETVNLIRPST